MNIMSLGILATVVSTAVVSSMEYYQFISSGKYLIYFSETIAVYALASVCEAVAEKYMVEYICPHSDASSSMNT